MTKRVALVDIDGCIVHENQLNQALVEQLREYDEIILFTQRSIFLQRGQITRKYQMSGVNKDELVNTPDVVKALGAALGKPIRVSTSIDPYYEASEPTRYYEDVLSGFEEQLKSGVSQVKQGDPYMVPTSLVKQYDDEIALVWKKVEKSASMKEHDPSSFYPQGKVEQFAHLREALPAMLGTDDVAITYFDDSVDNLLEVAKATAEKPRAPQCLLVRESYICPIAKWQVNHPNQTKISHEMQSQLQEMPLSKLCDYVVLREGERRTSQYGEYNSRAARFFAFDFRCATTKLSAAKKAIKILQGYDDPQYCLNENELKALEQGRLKDRIGDQLDFIKRYCDRCSEAKLAIIQ